MDRRKRKSQVAIKKAFLELIREKDFQSITIADITDRADLNRGTFYLHYEDKYNMIDKLEESFINELKDIIIVELKDITTINGLIHSRYAALIQIFDCFKNNQDILEIILKTKGILSLQVHLSYFVDQFLSEETILKERLTKNIPIELFRTLIVSICLGIVQYSMENNGEHTSEELTQGLLNIIINGPARAAGFVTSGFIDINKIIKIE